MLPGLDVCLKNGLWKPWGRVGLVTHQAVCTLTGEQLVNALGQALGQQLTCVFGPQHGYYQTEQDNMIETPDSTITIPSGATVPLFSLYGTHRHPTPQQLDLCDTLVVDLPDIGCRVYTYMLTLAECLHSAAKSGKRVVVLDRPNPLGLAYPSRGQGAQWLRCEGPLWDPQWPSFVGRYPIPMRHGLSLGELGRIFKAMDNLDVDLTVVPVVGLQRNTPPQAGGLWHLPSPNIPSWESAFLFPAFVALEATNVSEGRGTTKPFQLAGAPYIDETALNAAMVEIQTEAQKAGFGFGGIRWRTHRFRPTFNKHHGLECKGFHFSILDPNNAHLISLGYAFLAGVQKTCGGAFQWKGPPYEYNTTQEPIGLILGNQAWKDVWSMGPGWSRDGIWALNHSAQTACNHFFDRWAELLLYP